MPASCGNSFSPPRWILCETVLNSVSFGRYCSRCGPGRDNRRRSRIPKSSFPVRRNAGSSLLAATTPGGRPSARCCPASVSLTGKCCRMSTRSEVRTWSGFRPTPFPISSITVSLIPCGRRIFPSDTLAPPVPENVRSSWYWMSCLRRMNESTAISSWQIDGSVHDRSTQTLVMSIPNCSLAHTKFPRFFSVSAIAFLWQPVYNI